VVTLAAVPSVHGAVTQPRRSVASPAADQDVLSTTDNHNDGEIVSALDLQQRPVFSPAFASKESAMFFHTGGNGDARSALKVASPAENGWDLHVITVLDDGARNYHAQPSPDGTLVAFDSDRDGERGVYVANRNGTAVLRVSGPGYAAVPSWAPDGKRLAYVRAEPDHPNVWNLWLLSLDPSRPDRGAYVPAQRLTHFAYGQTWAASWFNDGKRICFAHEDKIRTLDLVSGRSQEFASPITGALLRTPAVSPDGTKVIFQVFRRGAWILDLENGSMRRVLTDPSAEEFTWAPDGRRIAFHSRRSGEWGIYVYGGN
jgi:Tol biopolymer transport system component